MFLGWEWWSLSVLMFLGWEWWSLSVLMFLGWEWWSLSVLMFLGWEWWSLSMFMGNFFLFSKSGWEFDMFMGLLVDINGSVCCRVDMSIVRVFYESPS
jgi:hypothetical protein